MPKLSLIMPAYNAEKTCRAAIESIICSDFDLEVIVVDDGSKDNTYQICKGMQNEDARVRVYTQTNTGVSSARNYGLRLATGEYIGFIDSDDKLSCEYVKTLFRYMKTKPDIIVFGYSNMFRGKRLSGWKPVETEEPLKLFSDLLIQGGGLNSPWNKLFKHSLINNIFNTKKSMGEDLEFCCDYLKQIKTCKTVPLELYLYNTDSEDSLTKKMSIVLDSIINDMKVLVDFTKSTGIDQGIVTEKFYQRIEGIMGSIEAYNTYRNAIGYLLLKEEFANLLLIYQPKKKKNILIHDMIYRKKYIRMYFYLLCKRCVRKAKQGYSRD